MMKMEICCNKDGMDQMAELFGIVTGHMEEDIIFEIVSPPVPISLKFNCLPIKFLTLNSVLNSPAV